MAQKIIREFVDDIDGSPAERTFSFAVDGVSYEIDLSTQNIAEFKSAIGGFIESARKVKGSSGRRTRSTPSGGAVGSPVSKPELYGSGRASTATTSASGAGSRRRSSRRSTKRTQQLSRR